MAKKKNEDLQEDIVKDNVNADESVKEEPELTETDESIEAEAEEKSDEELLQDSVEALKQENSELKDQYLRKHADFENYRKRMAKEKADSVRYGNQELLKDLIEVIDNFDRAIKSSADSNDFDSFKDGISMIEQQFTGMLESKWGLAKMNCTGSEYDPNSHEALMMEEASDIEVPTVMEDFQAGYTLHDRVIRPAKVKVGKPAAAAAE
ncbi:MULTISPECIES: nucleotide exchange factor GrpE [unclassified Oceanispirochaeta]|uniref:nucleotide exchange factor GrpE n=1 Tax=unclassified Oceanispirochaeta TaxID=2635722 RepID=UPI000E095A25|nr:nucleotide exchange factor GrpE [Oceanispirochaeta sp. M1]MBF9017170.1 nucleotide exchange factor GrpE [Oceanispirochaeta sp. M2]NPD73619.1 nucleotide exchange factor GrpE [Oceanispirochaeta sp. M1]RDG30722.1 nucleotide exchange factor GrpE [Oceanispirochaeta sp. M1]